MVERGVSAFAADRRGAATRRASTFGGYGPARWVSGGGPHAVLRQPRRLGRRHPGGDRFRARSRWAWLAPRSNALRRLALSRGCRSGGERYSHQLASMRSSAAMDTGMCSSRLDRGRTDLSAAFAIDAGGRTAPLARRLGAKRQVNDRLVCGWVHGRACSIGRGVGLTTVEAVPDGWWYTAPLPEERRVLAFLTDADLPAARIAHLGIGLAQQAAETGEIGTILAQCRRSPRTKAALLQRTARHWIPA